jgi:hypothetical protein
MLKGKQLYEYARHFCDHELLPAMAAQSEDEDDKLKDRAGELGIALAIDIAESLHRISVKVG